MDSRSVREGCGHLVNLLKLPREPGGVEERAHIEAWTRIVTSNPKSRTLENELEGRMLTIIVWAVLFLYADMRM